MNSHRYLVPLQHTICTRTLLGLSSLFLLCQSSQAEQIELSKINHSVQLLDLSKADSRAKRFEAATLMDVPVAQVCAAIMAYDSYPSFMPNTSKVSVVKLNDNASQVDFTLSLPLGKTKKYRLRMTPKQTGTNCHLSWKMLPWEGLKQEETIADTQGYWSLSSVSNDTQKTVVRYVVETDPGPVPLGLGWIVDSMSKDSIPKMLEALRTKLR